MHKEWATSFPQEGSQEKGIGGGEWASQITVPTTSSYSNDCTKENDGHLWDGNWSGVSLSAGAAMTSTGWLTQHIFIFSWFWRLDGQDQGNSTVGFLVRALFLVCRLLSSCYVFTRHVCHLSREKASSLGSFLGKSYQEGSTLMTQSPPKAHSEYYHIWS